MEEVKAGWAIKRGYLYKQSANPPIVALNIGARPHLGVWDDPNQREQSYSRESGVCSCCSNA
jgi:hypothetical protein